MKHLILLLAMGTSLAGASQVSPTEKWHTVSNKKVVLQFEAVDDPKQACERQSKAYGNKGFAYTVQACAFWWEDGRCHIITAKRVELDSLGMNYFTASKATGTLKTAAGLDQTARPNACGVPL